MNPLEKSQAIVAKMLLERPGHDVLMISQPIERALHAELTDLLANRHASGQSNDKCTLILTTQGGTPDAAYRIARCLRHHYSFLRLVVAAGCKSAGTLIAICADELAIGDMGELGPLDVQVRNPNELAERTSGLDIREAVSVISQVGQEAFKQGLYDLRRAGLATRLAGHLAYEMSKNITGPLYAQIDPHRLGELNRKMRITYDYGERLNEYAHNLKDGALSKLLTDYPSHSFVIDRKEAKDHLFYRVNKMSEAERELCTTLWADVGSESDVGPTFLEGLTVVTGEQNAKEYTAEANQQGSNDGNADSEFPAEPNAQSV